MQGRSKYEPQSTELRVPSKSTYPLLDFLEEMLKESRSRCKELVDSGSVIINNNRVNKGKLTVRGGDTLLIIPAVAPRAITKQDVLLENSECLVINKPPALLVNGVPFSLEEQLRTLFSEPGISAVHRLDRDTSGCVVLARHPKAQQWLDAAFRERHVFKQYHALVAGKVSRLLTKIEKRLDGKEALTELSLLKSTALCSSLAVIIHTGRTHQIRRHLSLTRHPVLGDREYESAGAPKTQFFKVQRQMLHSQILSFTDPITRKRHECKAPLPEDMTYWMKEFNLSS